MYEIEGKSVEKDIKEKMLFFNKIFSKLKRFKQRENFKEVFFKINGSKATEPNGFEGEADVQKIGALLQKQVFQLNYPLRWYAFELLLRQTAVSEPLHGILTVQICKEIRHNEFDMEPNEVIGALKFFHLLNTMLYYDLKDFSSQDSNESLDLVFVDPSYMFNIIMELILKLREIHDVKNIEYFTPGEKETRKAIIPESFLEYSETAKKVGTYIPDFNSKLLSLYVKLSIAYQMKENHYFIPALLPLTNPVELADSYPYVFYFKARPLTEFVHFNVPMGFFVNSLSNF